MNDRIKMINMIRNKLITVGLATFLTIASIVLGSI